MRSAAVKHGILGTKAVTAQTKYAPPYGADCVMLEKEIVGGTKPHAKGTARTARRVRCQGVAELVQMAAIRGTLQEPGHSRKRIKPTIE